MLLRKYALFTEISIQIVVYPGMSRGKGQKSTRRENRKKEMNEERVNERTN